MHLKFIADLLNFDNSECTKQLYTIPNNFIFRIFLCINQFKLKNVWVGRNLQIKNYAATNDFSKDKLCGTTVNQLISTVTKHCSWITVHRRKRPGTSSQQTADKMKKDEKIVITEEETNMEFQLNYQANNST